MSSRDLVVSAAGASAPSDPNFKNVSLLLSGDGTNGAQNNTFLDSSSNNFTITRNGNTTQGTFSPYGNLWSNYFDGSGDYLNIAQDAAFGFGTGDFSLEFWAFIVDYTRNNTILDTRTGGAGLVIGMFPNGAVNVYAAGDRTTASGLYPSNQWVHIAVTRSGTTLRTFINGVMQGYFTGISTDFGSSNVIRIGYQTDNANYCYGYISNLRIIKGSIPASYQTSATSTGTSVFTPSTTPLTAVSGTSLLTCQSNRFIDNSSNNFALTVNGNTSVQRFSPFNPTAAYDAATLGGSGYFDGSGDYIQAPSNSLWSWPLVSAWSGEAFIYPTSFSTYNPVFCVGGAGTNILDFYVNSSGNLVLRYWNGSAQVLTSSSTVKLNEWSHVVFAFNGTTLSTYINGARVATAAKQGTPDSNTNPFNIGYMTQGTGTGVFTGYISDVRVINGTLQYNPSNSTITVPTAPLTAITNTKLLCNFTNAGIPDAAMMNDLETVGNAQVSTSVKKYGTGSLAFDGTGDGLYGSPNQAYTFGTGDFTIEAWLYQSTADDGFVVSSSTTATTGWLIAIMSGKFGFGKTGIGNQIQSSTAFPTAQWVHVAVTRQSGTVRVFENGTQTASGTDTTNFATYGIQIGSNRPVDTGWDWSGYIDDLRITKGYARYTANFTPPAQALPTN